jgi:hypothetical protein
MGRSGGVGRSSGRATGSREVNQGFVAETTTGCRRAHGLLGRLARANLSKASLSACCKADSQPDKRGPGMFG